MTHSVLDYKYYVVSDSYAVMKYPIKNNILRSSSTKNVAFIDRYITQVIFSLSVVGLIALIVHCIYTIYIYMTFP